MNREDVAMDVTVQNVEILRGRLEKTERALAGMLFAFDDGVGQEWSADVLDFARKLVKAKELIDSQQGEQATAAENAQVHPEQAEGAQGELEALTWLESKLNSMPAWFGGEDHTRTSGWMRDQFILLIQEARAALAQPSPCKSQVAEALRVADWSNTCIGNKALILAAIEQLEAQPSPAPELERPETEQ